MKNKKEISVPLLAFTFFYAVVIYVFLLGFYFWDWHKQDDESDFECEWFGLTPARWAKKPFIKTCAYNIGTTDDFINAACLIDGEMHGFNACDAVEPIDAELIIKDWWW